MILDKDYNMYGSNKGLIYIFNNHNILTTNYGISW
jgi:hypothetical protein